MITFAHRPSCPDQIFSIWRMPRLSPQGRCWQLFSQLRKSGKLPTGIMPFEDVLEYGQRSLIAILPWSDSFVEPKLGRFTTICQALQKVADAFAALSALHSLEISLDYWPRFTPEDSMVWFDYIYDSEAKASFPSHGLGDAAPSTDSAYAEISARRFPRRVQHMIPCVADPPTDRHARSDPRLLCIWPSSEVLHRHRSAPAPASVSHDRCQSFGK